MLDRGQTFAPWFHHHRQDQYITNVTFIIISFASMALPTETLIAIVIIISKFGVTPVDAAHIMHWESGCLLEWLPARPG